MGSKVAGDNRRKKEVKMFLNPKEREFEKKEDPKRKKRVG